MAAGVSGVRGRGAAGRSRVCSRDGQHRRLGGDAQCLLGVVPLITVVLCFLHGFLKIRHRGRKAHDRHWRVWDVYRAATAEEFRRRMNALQPWCATQTWTAAVQEMLIKLWNKTEYFLTVKRQPTDPGGRHPGGVPPSFFPRGSGSDAAAKTIRRTARTRATVALKSAASGPPHG